MPTKSAKDFRPLCMFKLIDFDKDCQFRQLFSFPHVIIAILTENAQVQTWWANLGLWSHATSLLYRKYLENYSSKANRMSLKKLLRFQQKRFLWLPNDHTNHSTDSNPPLKKRLQVQLEKKVYKDWYYFFVRNTFYYHRSLRPRIILFLL